jgi:hypothetical protein
LHDAAGLACLGLLQTPLLVAVRRSVHPGREDA